MEGSQITVTDVCSRALRAETWGRSGFDRLGTLTRLLLKMDLRPLGLQYSHVLFPPKSPTVGLRSMVTYHNWEAIFPVGGYCLFSCQRHIVAHISLKLALTQRPIVAPSLLNQMFMVWTFIRGGIGNNFPVAFATTRYECLCSS